MSTELKLKDFTPPSFNDFLKQKYWAVHEAAFVLTQWPRNNLFPVNIYPSLMHGPHAQKNSDLDRSFLYLPWGFKIDPQYYGKNFEDVFNNINKAIENTEIDCKMHFVRGVIYFIKPLDIITWSLINGFIFSESLQEALGIRQDITARQLPSKTRNTFLMKVREKITGQLYLSIDLKRKRELLYLDVRKYLLHYFFTNKMKLLGAEVRYMESPEKQDLTATRRNLSKLYDLEDQKNFSKESTRIIKKYTPKAIEEVVKIDASGQFYYNFPLFKEAMRIVAYFKVYLIEEENISLMDKDEFVENFFNDEVVKLYSSTIENDYLKIIMKSCVEEAWRYLTWLDAELKVCRVREQHAALGIPPEENYY